MSDHTITSKSPSFDFTNSRDISSSSLIKSPLISEILMSHGLLQMSEDQKPLLTTPCNLDSDSKLFAIEEGKEVSSPNFHVLRSSIESYDFTDDDGEDDIHEGEDYECRWGSCNMRFSSKADLGQHVINSHVYPEQGLFYKCRWSGCARQGQVIQVKYRMLIHIRTHTDEKPHKCAKCSKRFSRLENLRIHTRSHTGEKPYVCSITGCGKAFSNSSDRYKHSKTHSEEKPYACRVEGCYKKYTDPSSLRKHTRSIHGVGRKATDHMVSEAAESTCGDPSSHLKNANKGLKLFACQVDGCNKSYSHRRSLRKHKLSHQNELLNSVPQNQN